VIFQYLKTFRLNTNSVNQTLSNKNIGVFIALIISLVHFDLLYAQTGVYWGAGSGENRAYARTPEDAARPSCVAEPHLFAQQCRAQENCSEELVGVELVSAPNNVAIVNCVSILRRPNIEPRRAVTSKLAQSFPYDCSNFTNGLFSFETLQCFEAEDYEDIGCGGNGNLAGNPCNAATGNKFQVEEDFTTNSLGFNRFYNSQRLEGFGLGLGWRHEYQRSLLVNEQLIMVTSITGKGEIWRNVDGELQGDLDSDLILSQTPEGFSLIKQNGDIENYDEIGNILSEVDTNGRQTNYAYNDSGNLESVTNHYGHRNEFVYQNNRLESITNSSNVIFKYEYDQNNNLIAVIFPDLTLEDDSDNPRKKYLYENQKFPNHLTGIIDENGDRYATWQYDNRGRAITSEHAHTTNAIGQEKVELVYIANLALKQAADQSSISSGAVASRAVDGNTDGNFFSGSTTHTSGGLESWWQVDLGGQAVISNVNIFNRTDCCSERLVDFYVFVSETPFDNQSLSQILENDDISRVYHEGTLSSNSISLQLPSKGRYVRVQLAGAGVVSLAEVQVIGREEN